MNLEWFDFVFFVCSVAKLFRVVDEIDEVDEADVIVVMIGESLDDWDVDSDNVVADVVVVVCMDDKFDEDDW